MSAFFAEGEVDRCPTGSGVSGRMPIHFGRKELAIGETMTIESITGSVFQRINCSDGKIWLLRSSHSSSRRHCVYNRTT